MEADIILEDDGNVLFSKNKIGKGSVYFFNAPLENYYTETYKPYETDLHEIYGHLFKDEETLLAIDSRLCCLTLHKLDEKNAVALIYNFGEEKELRYRLVEGYEIKKCDYGTVEKGKIIFQENFVCIKIQKNEK